MVFMFTRICFFSIYFLLTLMSVYLFMTKLVRFGNLSSIWSWILSKNITRTLITLKLWPKSEKKTPEICTLIAFAIFCLSILTSFRILLFCSLSKILLWYPYVYNLLLNYNRVTIKSHKQASIMKIASYLIKTRDKKIIFI